MNPVLKCLVFRSVLLLDAQYGQKTRRVSGIHNSDPNHVYKTDLHPVGGNNVPDVRDHDLGEDLVNQAMVANEASMGNVLHT